MAKKTLAATQREALLKTLKERFEANMKRHAGVKWSAVEARLSDTHLSTLNEMEQSGGEPDVIAVNKKTGEYTFVDCSAQSPKGRRSVCYDAEARNSRKEHKPQSSALEMAEEMGAALLSVEEYTALQKLGEFDMKTSSWIKTPADVRALGGALFCDRRYGKVFVYHNGAQSYYASRGFRGFLLV